MSLQCLVQPPVEPISLETAKQYIRVDHQLEDKLIEHFITASRQIIENYLALCLIHQVWQLTIGIKNYGHEGSHYLSYNIDCDNFKIILPKRPLIKINSIFKVDDSHNSRILSGYHILETSDRTQITIEKSQLHYAHQVIIKFEVGMSANAQDVPENLKQAILILTACFYENRADLNKFEVSTLLNKNLAPLLKPYQCLQLY